MSDIEKARKQLNISGYQHPTDINSSNNTIYKTFDSEAKDYGGSVNKSTYATFTEKTDRYGDEKQTYTPTDPNICPKCNTTALYACPCKYEDKSCKNGHVWYFDNNKIALGDPHE